MRHLTASCTMCVLRDTRISRQENVWSQQERRLGLNHDLGTSFYFNIFIHILIYSLFRANGASTEGGGTGWLSTHVQMEL